MDGVAHGPGQALAVQPHHLKDMPVQMHGMGHHRHVVKGDLDPLARAGGKRHVIAPAAPVDGPEIGRH
jgi:hypothetical protein